MPQDDTTSQYPPGFRPFKKPDAPQKSPYAKPGSYTTKLDPHEENQFQSWVKQNKVPWQDGPTSDYDMRGYYKAMKSGKAKQDPDTKHFPDTWKTPYHKSFSNESQYALPTAPRWKGNQLVDSNGKVVFEEGKQNSQQTDGNYPAGFRKLPPQFQPKEADKDVSPETRNAAAAARGGGVSSLSKKPENNPYAGKETIGPAPALSTFQQDMSGLKSMVANSAIGYLLEERMPKAADFLGLHPTEMFNNPYAQQHAEEILAPGAAFTKPGVAKGVAEFAGGLTTPQMVLMEAGSGGIGELEPLIGRAGMLGVSKLVSLGFSADMLRGAIQEYPALKEALARGDYDIASQMITEMGLQAVFSAVAFKHAASTGMEPIEKKMGATLDRGKAKLPEDIIKGETLADYGARKARELQQKVQSAMDTRKIKEAKQRDDERAQWQKVEDQNRSNREAAQGFREAAQRVDQPVIPEKKPFEEPAAIIRGRQPLSAFEREQERYDERVRQVKEELAEEKARRLRIAQKALQQGLDVEDKQLSEIAERREKALREGQGFTVTDRRAGLDATPDVGLTPTPKPEAAPVLEPPPQEKTPTLRDLEHHESVATWSIMEYEKRLAQARTPEERAELQQQIAENKQLLQDVREDKKATQILVTGKKPEARKVGKTIDGTLGNDSVLKTVTRDIPIKYKLVEGADLKASHNAESFEKTPGYPEGVQERDYKNDKDAQVAVIQHGQQYDPSFTVSDAPGPEHGPPIVTPDGIVLGGNSRVMSTMRHYGDIGDSGENGEAYRVALASKAQQFGIDPNKVKDMKNPILVREIQNPPESIQDMRALGSDLNRTFTRALSEYEQAVSAGKRISQETLDYVSSQLGGEGQSGLRDLLRERPGPILEKLSADGIISDQERRKFIDEKTGALNDAGKDFVERALLGAVVDDPRILADAPKRVLQRVEGALGSLAKIKARGEPWDITDYLKEALSEHIAAASKGESIEDHLEPPTKSMFPREPVHPIVDAIARNLTKSAAAVKAAYEGYAKDADVDVKDQGGLGFFTPPKPWDSFNDHFKGQVRENEWGTLAAVPEEVDLLRAESKPKFTPSPEEPAPAQAQSATPREELRTNLARYFPKAGPEEIEATMALIDARAKVAGKSSDEWIRDKKLEVKSYKPKEGQAEESIPRASVTFYDDGRTVLRAFQAKTPGVESLVHELGHIFRRDLSPEELKSAENAFKVKDGTWKRQNEEMFARSFEKYLADGKSPVPELDGVFAKLKAWLANIYYAMKGVYQARDVNQGVRTPLDIKISPEVQSVFDRMLGGTERPKGFREIEKPREESQSKLNPTETAKTMSDEELQKVVDQLDKQTKAAFQKREARARIEEMAKPFKEELAKRGPGKSTEDRSVVFTKDKFEQALAALKKNKPITLNYTEPEEKMIDSISVVMGHLFENGYRDFDSNQTKLIDLAGDYVKPYARAAYDKMLVDGKKELEKKLQNIIPEKQRQQLSSQLGLFEDHAAKNRRIELPPGVTNEETKAQKAAGSDQLRKEPNARPSLEGRKEAGGSAVGPNKPLGGDALRVPLSGLPGPRKGGRSDGSPEPARGPLRVVPTPKIDVEEIPTINPSVEPSQWKAQLEAANLPAELPPPTVKLTPKIEEKLILKGQVEATQAALTSLDKYNAVVLATSTGTGKMYMGSAILAERKPKFGLILSPNDPVSKKWIEVAKEYGVDVEKLPAGEMPTKPGVYVGTYQTAGKRPGVNKYNWDMVIADESHNARNWSSGTGAGTLVKELSGSAQKMVYMSATPYTDVLEMGYMDKLGLWGKQGFEAWAAKEFNTKKNESTGKWIVPFNPRKLAKLREELVRRGMQINMDRDMTGVQVHFSKVPLSGAERAVQRDIVKAFQLAEQYFLNRPNADNMIMATRGNAVTFMKSYLERLKLPAIIEQAKKAEAAGWKNTFFSGTKSEVSEIYDFLKPVDEYYRGEISRLLPKIPGLVETLQEHFGDDLANYTGSASTARQAELDAFNDNTKKHLVTTYGAGGVGVGMHDTKGDAPRAVFFVGLPWSGVAFDQALGRHVRGGGASDVLMHIPVTDSQAEVGLIMNKIGPRLESLRAGISGIDAKDPFLQGMDHIEQSIDGSIDYGIFGNKHKVGMEELAGTAREASAIKNIKELSPPSAEEAKNKPIRGAKPKNLTPRPETLQYEEPELEDLGIPRSAAERTAKLLRRTLVPEGAEKVIDDPRLLDYLQDQNQGALGEPGGEKPPKPPDEVIGDARIPLPGHSNAEWDLATPRLSQLIDKFTREHYGKYGWDEDKMLKIAERERGAMTMLAQFRTAPAVLRNFKMTEHIPREFQKAEMVLMRKVASYKVDIQKILGSLQYDEESDRKIYEALARSQNPEKELTGASSEWTTGKKPFTAEELRAAQRIRDEVYEPIIAAVRKVRPDVGYRAKYATLIRDIDELTPMLFPILSTDGMIPADLVKDFSLEVRSSVTKDPNSPFMLRRLNTPPKALRISEVLDAYVPSMMRVAEYTDLARKTAVDITKMPKSVLKSYTTKYARIFFGVPSEYQDMESLMNKFARVATKATYSAALDLNPSWFILHSMKVPFNVWPELGSKYAALGMKGMMTPEGHELVARSGVLQDTMFQIKKPVTKAGKYFSNFIHSGMIISDRIDRGTAYLGGLEKAKDLGLFGPKEKVGKITWERLQELAAEGVDVEKGMLYAQQAVARSNFMYTNANVQMFVHDHPLLGQFKSYPVRQYEFAHQIFRNYWEAKRQYEEAKKLGISEEELTKIRVQNGDYEAIEAGAKARRLAISILVGGVGAIGLAASGAYQKIWPYHLMSILSPPIMYLVDTSNFFRKVEEGTATEKEFKYWIKETLTTWVPGARLGYDLFSDDDEKKHRRHSRFEMTETP